MLFNRFIRLGEYSDKYAGLICPYIVHAIYSYSNFLCIYLYFYFQMQLHTLFYQLFYVLLSSYSLMLVYLQYFFILFYKFFSTRIYCYIFYSIWVYALLCASKIYQVRLSISPISISLLYTTQAASTHRLSYLPEQSLISKSLILASTATICLISCSYYCYFYYCSNFIYISLLISLFSYSLVKYFFCFPFT